LAGWAFGQAPKATFKLAAELGRLTHGHPSGYLPAGALAVIILRLVQGWNLRQAAEESLFDLMPQEGHGETSAALRLALQLSAWPPTTSGVPPQLGEGWVGEEALAIGLYCALVAPNLEEAVVLAANIDGDSDSTASIAGTLLGARDGTTAIPMRWLDSLELRAVIEEIAGDLHDCSGWVLAETDDGRRLADTARLYKKYPPN
jgi:ADP-ribosylglycohydrolase